MMIGLSARAGVDVTGVPASGAAPPPAPAPSSPAPTSPAVTTGESDGAMLVADSQFVVRTAILAAERPQQPASEARVDQVSATAAIATSVSALRMDRLLDGQTVIGRPDAPDPMNLLLPIDAFNPPL